LHKFFLKILLHVSGKPPIDFLLFVYFNVSSLCSFPCFADSKPPMLHSS
jgi:hypothetical protein